MNDDMASIYDILATYVAQVSAALVPSFKEAVDYPNVSFDPPVEETDTGTKAKPYLSVKFMPNFSEKVGLAFDSATTHRGLLQVSVFWPSDEGLIRPYAVAGQIAKGFAPGLTLSKNKVEVSVHVEPTVSSPIQESDLVQVPVTINWEGSLSPDAN